MSSPYRYHRQTLLPGIGTAGQEAIRSAHIAIIGVGALGCVAADMLCRAGIGTLTLIDRDTVDWTNLQRQTLYTEDDAAQARPKASAAAARLRAINSEVRVYEEIADLTHSNAESLLGIAGQRPIALLDGTDNFPTRYLLNDVATKHRLPLIYGGAVGTAGTQATLLPRAVAPLSATPCLRCIAPEPPGAGAVPTCDTAGVLAAAVTIVASCQVADALKIASGNGHTLGGTLLAFDLWTNARKRVALAPLRDERCPCCGLGEYDWLAGRHSSPHTVLCGKDAVQLALVIDVTDPDLAQRLSRVGAVTLQGSMLRVVFSEQAGGPRELQLHSDGRAVVIGTTDPDVAKGIVARFVGG